MQITEDNILHILRSHGIGAARRRGEPPITVHDLVDLIINWRVSAVMPGNRRNKVLLLSPDQRTAVLWYLNPGSKLLRLNSSYYPPQAGTNEAEGGRRLMTRLWLRPSTERPKRFLPIKSVA